MKRTIVALATVFMALALVAPTVSAQNVVHKQYLGDGYPESVYINKISPDGFGVVLFVNQKSDITSGSWIMDSLNVKVVSVNPDNPAIDIANLYVSLFEVSVVGGQKILDSNPVSTDSKPYDEIPVLNAYTSQDWFSDVKTPWTTFSIAPYSCSGSASEWLAFVFWTQLQEAPEAMSEANIEMTDDGYLYDDYYANHGNIREIFEIFSWDDTSASELVRITKYNPLGDAWLMQDNITFADSAMLYKMNGAEIGTTTILGIPASWVLAGGLVGAIVGITGYGLLSGRKRK